MKCVVSLSCTCISHAHAQFRSRLRRFCTSLHILRSVIDTEALCAAFSTLHWYIGIAALLQFARPQGNAMAFLQNPWDMPQLSGGRLGSEQGPVPVPPQVCHAMPRT